MWQVAPISFLGGCCTTTAGCSHAAADEQELGQAASEAQGGAAGNSLGVAGAEEWAAASGLQCAGKTASIEMPPSSQLELHYGHPLNTSLVRRPPLWYPGNHPPQLACLLLSPHFCPSPCRNRRAAGP